MYYKNSCRLTGLCLRILLSHLVNNSYTRSSHCSYLWVLYKEMILHMTVNAFACGHNKLWQTPEIKVFVSEQNTVTICWVYHSVLLTKPAATHNLTIVKPATLASFMKLFIWVWDISENCDSRPHQIMSSLRLREIFS